MRERPPARGTLCTVLMAVAVVLGSPARAADGRTLSALLAPVGNEPVLMTGAMGAVGESAFWRWAGTSGTGPVELSRAGLTPAELLEMVCQFADDIDLAAEAGGEADFADAQALIEYADLGRARIRAGLQDRPVTESPALPEDVSARPDCVLAPEPQDVAATLAEAPGMAPYLIERRLRQIVRRTSTIRILALPDAQQRGGDAP